MSVIIIYYHYYYYKLYIDVSLCIDASGRIDSVLNMPWHDYAIADNGYRLG